MNAEQNLQLQRIGQALDKQMTATNCQERLTYLLQAEEEQLKKDITAFDLQGVPMKEAHGQLLELAVPGLSENRPSVLKGDKIIVKKSTTHNEFYEGIVHDTREKSILVGFNSKLRNLFVANMRSVTVLIVGSGLCDRTVNLNIK